MNAYILQYCVRQINKIKRAIELIYSIALFIYIVKTTPLPLLLIQLTL